MHTYALVCVCVCVSNVCFLINILSVVCHKYYYSVPPPLHSSPLTPPPHSSPPCSGQHAEGRREAVRPPALQERDSEGHATHQTALRLNCPARRAKLSSTHRLPHENSQFSDTARDLGRAVKCCGLTCCFVGQLLSFSQCIFFKCTCRFFPKY